MAQLNKNKNLILIIFFLSISLGLYIHFVRTTSVAPQSFNKKQTPVVKNIININRATKPELQTLNGIGAVIAERVIEYRENNGLFKNIEDIKNVKGVGPAKYNIIKSRIKVD